ncbi:energy transducer TonB [Sphingobium sp. AN558]|uniref:energy transducer TonB n=1 Tax=Sphingobium sp. AN558 TaxID=3133442 RepID=UPI0030C55021
MHASSPGEKIVTGIGSVAVVAVIGWLLVTGLAVSVYRRAETSTTVMTLTSPKVRPERIRPIKPKQANSAKPGGAPGGTSAATIPKIAPAAPLAVPVPVIVLPLSRPAPVEEGGGSDGAGSGQGNGSGKGDGDGNEDGPGDGGSAPHLLKGRLRFEDMPAPLRAGGERVVAVRYAVDVNGHVADCVVTDTSGSADLDEITCRLIEKRFRFRPSRDENGEPVRSIIVERHRWRVRHDDDGNGGG